ncbi:MAG: hypothetical protein JO010_08670 [Alphaproteobacteria bacterium]|nr:hypothetical protein [Alphaproteobacteria bacterium]
MTIQRTTILGAAARKAVMTLGIIAALGGLAAAPAFADQRGWENGGYHRAEPQYRHGDWGRDHSWREARAWHSDRYRGREDRPYFRPAPVYNYAPPAYYAAPGVTFGFTVPLR